MMKDAFKELIKQTAPPMTMKDFYALQNAFSKGALDAPNRMESTYYIALGSILNSAFYDAMEEANHNVEDALTGLQPHVETQCKRVGETLK